MKKEIFIVTLVVALIGGVTFKMGLNMGRADDGARTPGWNHTAPAVVPADVANNDERQRCLDARHKEQLEYIEWRGKHIQQLEACTASLGEATRALVHRARVSP